jgi:nucleotide-binding universal stress UspA family protein
MSGMTKTLLVPLDGSRRSERAVPVATALARRIGADVALLTTRWSGLEGSDERYLASLAKRDGDVVVRTDVVPGLAPAAIASIASDLPDVTICMASHGRGGFRWALLGSVAEQVVRDAGAPVLLVGRHTEPIADDATEVVVAWDGAPASLAIVPAACKWAVALGTKIHFVRVVHPLDVEPRDRHDDALEAAVVAARAYGLPVERSQERDAYFSGRLADVAVERRAAMIAMTTHARTGIERVGIGSVTMGVVGGAPCPVLVTCAST